MKNLFLPIVAILSFCYFNTINAQDCVDDDTAAAELAGADLESQFAALEGKNDLDDELNSLRQKLQGGAQAVALPSGETSSSIDKDNDIEVVKVSEVDSDLEELKRSMEKL